MIINNLIMTGTRSTPKWSQPISPSRARSTQRSRPLWVTWAWQSWSTTLAWATGIRSISRPSWLTSSWRIAWSTATSLPWLKWLVWCCRVWWAERAVLLLMLRRPLAEYQRPCWLSTRLPKPTWTSSHSECFFALVNTWVNPLFHAHPP